MPGAGYPVPCYPMLCYAMLPYAMLRPQVNKEARKRKRTLTSKAYCAMRARRSAKTGLRTLSHRARRGPCSRRAGFFAAGSLDAGAFHRPVARGRTVRSSLHGTPSSPVACPLRSVWALHLHLHLHLRCCSFVLGGSRRGWLGMAWHAWPGRFIDGS